MYLHELMSVEHCYTAAHAASLAKIHECQINKIIHISFIPV